MRFAVTGAVVIAISTACAAAPAHDNAADLAALKQADSAYAAGMAKLDIPSMMKLYATETAAYPPNEPAISGFDAMQKYAEGFAQAPGLTMSSTPQTVEVSQSGDLGYTIDVVELTTKDSAGNATSDRLRDIHIWRKDAGGQWKIVYDFWNSERPLASPPRH